jgi:asparagine synthase (glutamine-hydrolysing)
VFVLAWGERAVELLVRAGGDDRRPLERSGELAVAGLQSASDGAWRCWISGRLTNGEALRERLGLSASAESDALLARLFAQLGVDACALLRGTFIVVAYDGERQTAWVVRDQLGGRPLLQLPVGAGALMAEHEHEILDLLPRTPAPNRLALTQWIDRGTTPPRQTLYEGIARIPAGHRVVLSRAEATVEPYWRARYRSAIAGSRELVAERLRSEVFAAIARAASGARQPAVRLSGGLDSACVAAGLAQQATDAQRPLAFGATFPTHPQTDERELIEATARFTNASLALTAFDDTTSILAPALEHIARWRVPPVSPNLFVWKPVMASARARGVDVMLDGEGGDELFAFSPYLIADMLRRGRALAAWRLTGLIPEVGAQAGTRMRLRALRVYGVRRLVPPAMKRTWTPTHNAETLMKPDDATALRELARAIPAPALDGPQWWCSLAGELTDRDRTLDISGQLRRESIDEEIERRHPFLFDVDLLEGVLANPPLMQFDPLRDRALLRDAMRGQIPEEVRTRHAKSFFTDLLPAGLRADGALLGGGPASADAPVREFVSAEALASLLHRAGSQLDIRAARRLWQVGLADAWLRAFERREYPLELRQRALRAA